MTTSRLDRQKAALEEAEKRLSQAKARRDKAAARLSSSRRKIDTRAKIILGGALLALLGRGHGDAERAVQAILTLESPRWTARDQAALRAILEPLGDEGL
ncbi:MAG: hypothetical protein WAQ27_06335 [Candidatus Microsaccharimonas sp.]